MAGDAPDTTTIQTPVELDLLAREAQRQASRSASPLFRFTTITAFFRRSGHLPPLWTGSYYRSLYPIFSAAIRHEYVCWVDPEEWLTALRALRTMKDAEWTEHEATFGETENIAWKKSCLCLAGMGAFRNLHELLRAQGWAHADLSDRDWSTVLNAHTVGLDAFDAYCEVLQRQDECPPFLLRARERWEHYRADGVQPGVILLDGQESSASSAGLVLHLSVDAKRSVHTRAHFLNPLDEHNTGTMRQLADAAHAATALATEHFHSRIPQYEWTVGFHEHEASYTGESMGIAVALSMAHRIQTDMNRALRWQLRPNLVCTGGIDASGIIRELPDAVIAAKVRAAFFSPADALVLPARHAEQARLQVLALQQRYPDRRFEVYGVTSIDDCVSAQGIIRSEYRTIYDRTREFVRTHSVLLLVALVFVLAAAGGYFWWKSLYGYPDLEFTIDTQIEENALVFNPHRSNEWEFRDFDRVVHPVLPFGDLETGADATRNVYIWNMTPTVLAVRLGIEGPQADQWYISWHGGAQSVEPTSSLRVMIKYVPTRAAKRNAARFTVRDPESGALLTELRLVGAAGPPLPGGYALALDGIDDMLFFGEQAIAFARDEATIEWWMRLDANAASLMSNNRNSPQTPAMANMGMSISNDTVNFTVGNNSSSAVLPRPIARNGLWHHFALVYSREKQLIRLIVDGELLMEKREEFIIEWANKPFVTFGAYNNGESVQSPMRGALDELRVWDRVLPPDTIRARMRTKVDALSPGLVGYWDFDVVAEVSAHNANERTQDGQLLGRPAYIRSAVPLKTRGTDIRLMRGPGKSSAIELQDCRWLQCGSDPIHMSPERSYAIRFRHDDKSAGRVFSVVNQDAYFILESERLGMPGAPSKPVSMRQGWNTAVVRIDREQNLELFVNGARQLRHSTGVFRYGPSHRYEGLLLGLFNDKYNSFGPKPYDHARPLLRTRRALTDFRIWARRISDDDIAAYERGGPTPDGLVAHWPLDTLPDPDGNYRDRVGGHLMHLWRYKGWE